MTKETLLENLKAAKGFTSVLLIEDMIKLIEGLEPEVKVVKEVGITRELADDISYRINAVLEHNCRDLVDSDTAEFELTHHNTIELVSAEIDTNMAIEHIDAVLDQFIIDEVSEEEEGDEAEEMAMGFETESEETEE
jgi:electron transfer flavoprotein alpha subunit